MPGDAQHLLMLGNDPGFARRQATGFKDDPAAGNPLDREALCEFVAVAVVTDGHRASAFLAAVDRLLQEPETL